MTNGTLLRIFKTLLPYLTWSEIHTFSDLNLKLEIYTQEKKAVAITSII